MISKISKTIDYDKEFFVTIDDFPNYKVDVEGRVLNVKTGRILKPALDDGGYYCVMLSNNRERETRRVHQLVASAFLNKPNENVVVDHINNIRSDNRIENLRYVTSSDNSRNRLGHIGNIKYEFVDEIPLNSLHITHVKGIDVSELEIYYNKQTDNFYMKMTTNKWRVMYKENRYNLYRITFTHNNRVIKYSINQLRNEYQSYFEEE